LKEIDEFKQENGGIINYTVKELLAGLHKKVDKFKDCFDVHRRKSEGKIKILETLVGVHTLLIIGLLWMNFSS